jgi:uncharacterized protein
MMYGALAWAAWWLVVRPLADASSPWTEPASGFGLLQDQWLCFGYIGGLLLLLTYRPSWTHRLRLFSAAGRMALTNYIAQVIVVDVLASGYGLALRLRPLAYLPAAVALFASLALASQAWLRRYRMGPLEWIWRVITLWGAQPLRR